MRHPSESEISAALDGHFFRRDEEGNEVVDTKAKAIRRPYSANEEQRLIDMYHNGLSYFDIEDLLDRSHSSVSHKLAKLFRSGKLIARRVRDA